MRMCIEIEIDDKAPNEELCGKDCKGLNRGICKIFNLQLEENSFNKINDMMADGTLVYDETRIFHEWKRCEKCINLFYSFGKIASC